MSCATIDAVDLLMTFGEVAIWFFGLFLLIGPFGHLEHLICETLESIVVLGLVLSLGVKNADAIQEAFKFSQPRPVLLVASWLFHRVDKRISFPLLVVALGKLGWSVWPDSFSSFCSLVSRGASSVRAYLLVIANISSDVLGFFMASLRIKDESLSPFLKNMMICLLSTSRMMFLLLQKCWINSRSDSPFF
jgi:hypothetical protein